MERAVKCEEGKYEGRSEGRKCVKDRKKRRVGRKCRKELNARKGRMVQK